MPDTGCEYARFLGDDLTRVPTGELKCFARERATMVEYGGSHLDDYFPCDSNNHLDCKYRAEKKALESKKPECLENKITPNPISH